MTIMVTLENPETGTRTRRVQAAEYPGYEGWSVIATEEWPTLAMAQEAAWARVKEIREDKQALATTTFGTAQTDLASMVKINRLVSMAMLAQATGVAYSETFTMADNSDVVMTARQMVQFGYEVGTHIASVHARGRALRAQIRAATDATEAAAIDLAAGWP